MKKIKNIIIIALGIVTFIICIGLFHILIVQDKIASIIKEDQALNREYMYYDLGEGKTVTVMLKDSLAYIMPYRYEGNELPIKDYVSFIRNYNDQYIAIYFKGDTDLVLGPKWNIDSVNMCKYKYQLFGDYAPISFRKRSDPKKFMTSENLSAITDNEKKMLDSLSHIRYFSIVSDGEPLIIEVTRADNDNVTSHMYRGHKESKNK